MKSENNYSNAYQLYSNWCRKKNEMPIPRNEFEKLTNAKGSINLADVLDKHRYINPSQNGVAVDEGIDKSPNEYEAGLQKEKEEQKNRDEKIVSSAIAGFVTNSTIQGTILGGSLLGGLLGDCLNKKGTK